VYDDDDDDDNDDDDGGDDDESPDDADDNDDSLEDNRVPNPRFCTANFGYYLIFKDIINQLRLI